MIFCQVDKIKQFIQVIFFIILINQKWNGGVPNLIRILRFIINIINFIESIFIFILINIILEDINKIDDLIV